MSGGRRLLFIPYCNSTLLPVSTSEWIASESMAELPENAAAANLLIATAVLPAMAARIAVFGSCFIRLRCRLCITEPAAADIAHEVEAAQDSQRDVVLHHQQRLRDERDRRHDR